MDQVTRLRIEIERSTGILQRIAATRYLTDADRRYKNTLEQAVARKQEMVRRLERFLTPRH